MLAARCTANGTSFANRGGPNRVSSPSEFNPSEISLGIFAVAIGALVIRGKEDIGGTGSTQL